MKTIAVKINEETQADLKRAAKIVDLTVPQLVRRLILAYLDQTDPAATPSATFPATHAASKQTSIPGA
jgi:hypothetical protein